MGILSQEDRALFFRCVKNLNEHTDFEKLKAYKHHHHTSTYYHSIWVAYVSFCMSKLLRLKCDDETLIYGALLHDYYLYDCHQDEKSFHLFKHPKISAANAKRDWSINHIQENMIKRHMFPITLIPPRYKESVLVNLADKMCALYECLHKNPYNINAVNAFV